MIYFLSLLLTLPFQFAIPFPWVGDVPLARIIAATIIGLFLIGAFPAIVPLARASLCWIDRVIPVLIPSISLLG